VNAASLDVFAGVARASYEMGMNSSESENVKAVVDAVSRTEVASDPRSVADALRAMIAGGRAAHVMTSSVSLFEAGGKTLLSEGTKTLVRSAAERGAQNAFGYAAGPLLGAAAPANAPSMITTAVEVAYATGPLAARAAAKELLKGAGRAGGLGFLIDGAIASLEAAVAVRDGVMDRRRAAFHVAKEAATGAASTGAGVLLGAGMVALTGGVAAPVVFAVGAFGALGTKRLLRRLTEMRWRSVAISSTPPSAQ
jgi:hypothetical protein